MYWVSNTCRRYLCVTLSTRNSKFAAQGAHVAHRNYTYTRYILKARYHKYPRFIPGTQYSWNSKITRQKMHVAHGIYSYTLFTLKLGTTNTHTLHQIHIARKIHQFYTSLNLLWETYTQKYTCRYEYVLAWWTSQVSENFVFSLYKISVKLMLL